jgi:hypothetical protein
MTAEFLGSFVWLEVIGISGIPNPNMRTSMPLTMAMRWWLMMNLLTAAISP